MFKGMKLATKLSMSFGVMVVIAGVLGYMGWSSLGTVVARVENADDGNRLLKFAKDLRIQEKNFMLREDKKFLNENDETLAAIYEQIDETKAKFKDAADINTITQVKSKGQAYKKALDGWVDLHGRQQTNAEAMVTNARAFINECDAIRTDQKVKLVEDLDAAEDARADRLWKADTANRLIKISSAARLAQLKYMSAKDQAFVDENHTAMKEFYAAATELKNSFNQQENKAQADNVYTAGKAYQANFDSWVAEQADLEVNKKNLIAAGDRASAECQALRISQKEQLEKDIASGADAEALQERVGKVDDANRLVKYILESAVARRDFMMNPTDEYKAGVLKINRDLIAQCEKTKGNMNQAANREQLDRIIAATREYVVEFNTYCDSRKKQGEAAAIMVARANALVAECEAMRTDQKNKLAKANEDARVAIAGRVAKADDANRLIKWAKDTRVEEKNFMLRGDKKYQTENDATMKSIYGLCDDLKTRFRDPKNKEQVARIRTAAEKYKENFDGWIAQYDQQLKEEEAMVAAARDFVSGSDELRQGQKEKMTSAAAFSTQLMLFLAAAGVILGTILAFVITRGITKPLNRIIVGLNEGADQVNDAAGQVSTASQQLAEGNSEQASSLEETSSALEQMAAMTRTNAENAKQANDLSGQASKAANEGDNTMGQLNEAMTGINDSSEKISKIIKVIEEIAFQTNLLALNAAVEAARAGEHGKGFAVVADEVRNLAQRSAQAARETTELIENAVNNSRQGTQVAGEVGKALGAIVGDVTKVTDLIDGISKATEEQAQGVDQVNTAVSQMDKVTQQNAAGAEESASAAEELAAQATSVKGVVDELAAMVGGSSVSIGSPVSMGAVPKTPKKHFDIKRTQLKKGSNTGLKPEPVAAHAGRKTDSGEDFMSLDDKSDLKDF